MTNIYIWYFCQVRTENVWWRNQGILGVGNRHDNILWYSQVELIRLRLLSLVVVLLDVIQLYFFIFTTEK